MSKLALAAVHCMLNGSSTFITEADTYGLSAGNYLDSSPSVEEVHEARQALIEKHRPYIIYSDAPKRQEQTLEASWMREYQQELDDQANFKRELAYLSERRDGRTAFVSLMDYVHECLDHHNVAEIPYNVKQFVQSFKDQIPFDKTKVEFSPNHYFQRV
jgi:transposase